MICSCGGRMKEARRQPNGDLLLVCRDSQPRTGERAGCGRVHLLPKRKTTDAWWLRLEDPSDGR